MADQKAGDEHMGTWVYCNQHLRPHMTGWCTVNPRNKISLKAQNETDAYAEVREKGLPIYGETPRTKGLV